MELQGSGWYVKLSSGIYRTVDIHGHSPSRKFLKQSTSSKLTLHKTHPKVPSEHIYI